MKDISFSKFRELHIKGYSLDMVFLLMKMKNDEEIPTDSVKITGLIATMERKGLITENGKPTLDGQQLLDFILSSTGQPVQRIVKRKIETEFDKFWNSFPSTDTFEYKGVKFAGSRALRINKTECELKLKAILNEGEHTIDQIVAAIEYDILAKKEASIKQRTNKLTYVQNSLTYLRQRSFEPFIELISKGNTVEESPEEFNGTEI